MKTWMKQIFLWFCVMLPTGLTAQFRLTLEDCIRRAADANPELKNSRLDVRIQRNDYVAAVGELLPEVEAETRLGKRSGRAVDPNTNLFATQEFVEGNLSLNISVPLFEGFTRMNKVFLQRINRQMGEWTAVRHENELGFGVMDAFYRVLFQEQLLTLAVEQRRLSEDYYRRTEEYVREGLKASVDLQEMKARLGADVYQESLRRRAGRIAMLELKQLLWLTPEDSLQLVAPEAKAVLSPVLSARSVYGEAENFLPQFRLMELKMRAARKNLSIAGGRFSPSLKGEVGFYSGYYDTEKDGDGKVVSYGKQLDNNLNRYYGLTLSLPIVGGFRNLTGMRKARLRLEQTRNLVESERRELFTQVEDACVSLQASADELYYAKELQDAERQALQQAEEKWKEGLVSVFELMEIRNRFYTARAEIVRTQLQYEIKQRTVDFFRGKPLAGDKVD